jgi:excinuclease ABC subunit B
MQRALAETGRRRERQISFNAAHGITPRGVIKPIKDIMEGARASTEAAPATSKSRRGAGAGPGLGPAATPEQIAREIRRLESEMLKHARNLEFEEAAACRDVIQVLQQRLLELA